jgi:hypothetical protein
MNIAPGWLDGLIGFVMPVFIRLIAKAEFPKLVKFGIAVVSCVAVGTISAIATGHLQLGQWFATISYIFSVSQVVWNLFWKPIFNHTVDRGR